ncbi:MAG: hypothetical protein K2K20_01815 [Lachnospiraceae bacterium]|nr:hypothetical protein [Lachnospiraceae bacterium]
MRQFSKGLTTVLCVMVFILALTSCASSMSVTCNVGTGDTIKVTLDTSEGFMLEEVDDDHFAVTENGDTVCKAVFFDEDDYEHRKYMYDNMERIEIIEEGSGDGLTWTLYNIDLTNCGRTYIVWIDGSNTGLELGSSEEYSEYCEKVFNSLTFSVE